MVRCCRSTAAPWCVDAPHSTLHSNRLAVNDNNSNAPCSTHWPRCVNRSSPRRRATLAKSAALSFIRQLAHEVGRQGVTANALSLGAMNNFGYDEIAKRNTAVGRAGTPDDVGAAVAYLASSEASWMSGQALALNGGSCTA